MQLEIQYPEIQYPEADSEKVRGAEREVAVPSYEAAAYLDGRQSIDAIIQRYRPMPIGEEYRLIERAQRGCVRSRNRLLNQNMGFIVQTISKTYPNIDRREMLGMLGTATIGFNIAIQRFDAGRGLRLISYAVWWVKAYLRREAAVDAVVRPPTHYAHLRGKLAERMAQTGESAVEAGKAIGLSERVIGQLGQRHISLDWKPDGDEGARSYSEVLADHSHADPDEAVVRESVAEKVRACVDTLEGIELDVIRRRFGFGGERETLERIGKDYSLSRERIRQIETRGKRKLFHRLQQRGVNPDALTAFR